MDGELKALLKSLPLAWNCRFLSDAPGEKFSGGFYRHHGAGIESGRWSHPYFAFIYLLDGSGVFTDHRGRDFEVVPGSLLLRFPDKPFTLQRRQPEWFEFASAAPLSLYRWLLEAKILDEGSSFFLPGLSWELVAKARAFVESLAAESLAASGSGYLELLHHLLAPPRGGAMGERAKLILGADLDKELDMPSVAAKLCLGYEAFRKKFTADCGVSPLEYRIRRRLEEADRLLLHSDMSVKEISQALGYPNDSDFIRQYRRRRNIPPGDFRKSNFV